MKRFKIKRLSDQQILFTQDRATLYEVEIPAGWGLHLEHQVQSRDLDGNLLFDVNELPIMETVPATCEIIEIDLATDPDHLREVSLAQKIALGKSARSCCVEVLDLIAGYNLERQLTAEQITQMVSTFGNALSALQLNRPDTAKTLISAISPDGVLVTQDMIDDVLLVFTKYGL